MESENFKVIRVTRACLEASCRANPLRKIVADEEIKAGRLIIVEDLLGGELRC